MARSFLKFKTPHCVLYCGRSGFEGAKIACGMRGAEGAIEHAHLEEGRLVCKVIGDGKPTGICGSGLIDNIAGLLEAGVIDETGRLMEGPRVVQIDDNTKTAYLLAGPSESGNGKPVYLSQKDIREVQLAKGAIAAGIAPSGRTDGNYFGADRAGLYCRSFWQLYGSCRGIQDRHASGI